MGFLRRFSPGYKPVKQRVSLEGFPQLKPVNQGFPEWFSPRSMYLVKTGFRNGLPPVTSPVTHSMNSPNCLYLPVTWLLSLVLLVE
jgi:hypothetical protein